MSNRPSDVATNTNVEGATNTNVQGAMNINVLQGSRFCPMLKPEVIVTGAAKEGRRKPPADPVVVISHDTFYHFTVDLPAASRDLDNMRLGISAEGKLHIQGTVTAGEAAEESSAVVLNKRSRRLSPAAPFSISFSLPGPIDVISCEFTVHPEGLMVFRVMKKA